ncbi:carbohydrate ABC transporter permease [Glaciibacter superstes]|uniref:carbohydrate ABC transporter permease n=1 Tax=Glaciibacter superstes TaxID=501023 RepID=UPI00040638A6|nr:sugar ABC transporter permease [Glaciibacter superstes]
MRPPGLGWAAPATLFFAVFAIIPLIVMAWLSFTTWSGIGSPAFVGSENWERLVADPAFQQILWITVVITLAAILVQTPISLLLGVWAAGGGRTRAIVSAICFVPLLLSSAAIAVLWRGLLDPNFGIPGELSDLFGGSGNVFASQWSAIIVLTFVSAWQYAPFHTLIFQGGARAIPAVLYQAAEIDGAGKVRQFFSITLPQLRNSLITSLILGVVGSLTTFDTILILTRGGPGGATTNTAYFMYTTGFLSFDFGMGSAAATVLVIAASLISFFLVRSTGYDRMTSEKEGV